MDLEILKIASDTKNHKVIKNHTHKSKNKNPLCGDEMEISVIVKNDKIIDFLFQRDFNPKDENYILYLFETKSRYPLK